MDDRYKKLVNLTDRVVKKLSLLEKERGEILADLRKAREDINFLKKEQEKYKSLRLWQQETTAIIKQVQTKIAKEIKKIEDQSSKPYLGGKNE